MNKWEGELRIRAAAIALGLAMIGVLWTPPAFAHQARQTRVLPRLITQSFSGIRPRDVFFSGDAGNIVTGIRWRWDDTSAVGHGTSNIQGCVPNCAEGKETPVATTVTFSKPVRGHFTKVVEVRDGHRLTGYYGRPSWPEGAR